MVNAARKNSAVNVFGRMARLTGFPWFVTNQYHINATSNPVLAVSKSHNEVTRIFKKSLSLGYSLK